MTPLRPPVLAALTALTLTACGGSDSGPSRPAPSPDTIPSPADSPAAADGPTSIDPPAAAAPPRLIAAHIRPGDGRTLGIGPAFRHESPSAEDLATMTPQGDGTLHSGLWRDPLGRDGSASAFELLAFLQAFQDQADTEGDGDLIITHPAGPRTVRLGQGATPTERETVDDALRILNTALPWDRRLRLGADVALAATDAGIPADEIHLHFTNGQTGWPAPDEGGEPWTAATLGIGGAEFDRDTRQTLGGNAYIDRTHRAFRSGRADLRITVLHELLHALGIIAHVNPAQYPTSILQPRYDPAVNPDLYVTLDGTALRALARLPVGTPINDLTVADFGAWETVGFHLIGVADLADTEILQHGVLWRNGLPTPWVYGPQPDRPLAHLGTRATWAGLLLGFTRREGRTVAGEAAIAVNLDRRTGEAAFTHLESWSHRAHPGNPGTGTRWGDGDLAYTLTLWEDGLQSGFDAAFAPGDDPGIVTGVFVGTAHEGAAGVLEHPDLSAAFGAVRE